MRLVADRFVMQDDGAAIDLATAQSVWLSIEPSGEAGESRRWTARCDELQRLRHFALAPLVDYGPIEAAQRFEAWQGAGVWTGADEHAHRTVAFASAFLRSLSLTIGSEAAYRIVQGERSALAIAPADAGYAIESDSDVASAMESVVPGVALLDRPAIGALAEMFTTVSDRRPRVAALWGPSGSGVDTAILVLARSARMQGFVPIDARLLDAHRALLADRSLCIIERRASRRLAPWLHALLRSSRPHVCLLAGAEEVRGVDGVALGRVTADALVAAVRPAPSAERLVRVQREAERALGLPARFARALWPAPFVDRARRQAVASTRVAERLATYDRSEPFAALMPDPASVSMAQTARVWPFPGELARLRQQVESANALLASGRHAPGLRLLRQAAAGLARRDAWEDAARGELTLAERTRERGRPRDALRVLDQAREHAVRCDDATLLVDVAIATGESWTDLARLDEAERVCRGALATARTLGDAWRAGLAATGLARGLFWRGAYADAAMLLGAEPNEPSTTPVAVRRLRLAARTRMADGATAAALAALAEAREKASVPGHGRLLVDVDHTEAFVRLRMGDLDGADRHLAACIAAAQRGRQPLRMMSARLMQAEADRRRGRLRDLAAIDPLRRLTAAAPPLIRARWDLLKALVENPGDPAIVDRFADRSGLPALRLFVQAATNAADPLADPFVEETVEILRVCQHADDEPALLAAVCARVRQHVHAASVAFVAVRDGGRVETLASEGPRMDPQVAERAIQVGVAIAPHRVHERLEAASAVVYGGTAIGALCARWTVGGTDDLSRAPAVLSMAATAAAPVLSALLARRSQLRPAAAHDLLGITSAMADLRRAVERAAPAPFAVLIEGESGSGKELVARAIHRCSARRDRAFCTLNCAALPDDLVEAELFGHARGAFTGAVAERPGVFEEAHNGTLFLDEIGELSPRAQAKILRVIQEGELRRVGENTARRIDVRIVSATNRDLRREVEAARFRLDLLYRLDVVRIVVPPLRERREDVAVLVDHFWLDTTRRMGSMATLAASTRAALAGYDWPGNVRELQNVLAGLAVRSPKRGVVHPSALPTHLAAGARRPATWRLDSARRTFEEAFVRAALVRSGGHRGRAAADLGVTRQGLTKLITRLGIGK